MKKWEKLKNAEEYLKKKIDDIKKVLPDAEIYIFGSVAEGIYDITSDIDVAIVSNAIKDKIKTTLHIQRILGIPFEIHLFTKEEWENYKKFINYKKIC
jgi:predicted nucleotidyltransferase